MDYIYIFELNFNDGAGWLVVNNDYIITESIKRKLCFHNNLEPNSNSLQFQIRRDCIVGTKTLSNYLLTSSMDIQIRVTRAPTGSSTYAPYFAGYLSDNYKIIVNHSGIELIDMKAEDGTDKLLKRKYPKNLNILGKKICDTSNFSNSLLYLAFGTGSDASYVPFDTDTLPNITNTLAVGTFSNYEDKTTYDYLKSILYEYGYTFLFNESGEVVVKSYKPISTTPTTGFYNKEGSRNIYGRVEINKNRVQYNDITVNFQTLKTLSNVIVFTDTTGGDSISKCNIDILAGDYYPEGATASDDDGIVYSDYKLETGENIISVGGITLDVIKDSQITLLDSTNLYKRCKLKYVNDGASTYQINKLDIIGTSVIAEDIFNKVYKIVEEGGDKHLKYESAYINSLAEGEFLAQTLVDYYKYANIKYVLQSDAVFNVGDFVKIEEDAFSGIDTMAQIMEIEDYADTAIRKYTLIGANTLSVDTIGDTSWLNASPTINNYNPEQEVTTQDVVDAIASSDVVSLQRAAYFSEGKGLIIPLDVYPEGGIAEPSYAMVKQLASQFGTVSTYVILDPDPVQPYSSTELFYQYPNISYSNDANYIKWQFYLDAIKELRKVGVKVLLKASSVTDIDNLIRWYKVTTFGSSYTDFDGIVIPELNAYWPYYGTYDESLNTALKTITDYAHLKGYYPVASLSSPVQKYLTNKAIDISIDNTNAGRPINDVETVSLTYTNILYRGAIEGYPYSGHPFDSDRFKELSDYFNLLYSQNNGYQITNGGRKYKDEITVKAEVGMKLTVGRAPYDDPYYGGSGFKWIMGKHNFQAKAQMKFDLTVQPQSVISLYGKLSPEVEDQFKLLSGSTSWQDVIDSAAAATPRTPTVSVTEFVSTAELSWEYQTDLGPALKYYEILVSKDHDPEDSDPDNGTWYQPRNDGVDWCVTDETDPLQVTNEFYTFKAPLDLDGDDNSIESTYFFKVRRVSTSNSGWGYSSATLRPLASVEIGKDTILAPHIMAGAITADKIAANTITAAHIASVDGGAIKTGNIQSETYSEGTAGWKMALSGSAEFNDVTVRGTVYATSGVFSGSINSGPLMLNLNPPSTTSKTITSGNSFVTWLKELQSAASITSGSFNCSGIYNGTALGRIEISQITETPIYEQWQQTGTHVVESRIWGITGYNPPVMWTDSWGIVHVTPGGAVYGWINTSVTVEDDVLWRRTTVKYTYQMKLYNQSNGLLVTLTDWYETAGTWVNTGTTGTNKGASTSAPSAASATQGTVTFAQSGTISFSATAYTYRLLNLPVGNDVNYPSGTVYMDVIDTNTAYLKIRR